MDQQWRLLSHSIPWDKIQHCSKAHERSCWWRHLCCHGEWTWRLVFLKLLRRNSALGCSQNIITALLPVPPCIQLWYFYGIANMLTWYHKNPDTCIQHSRVTEVYNYLLENHVHMILLFAAPDVVWLYTNWHNSSFSNSTAMKCLKILCVNIVRKTSILCYNISIHNHICFYLNLN